LIRHSTILNRQDESLPPAPIDPHLALVGL